MTAKKTSVLFITAFLWACGGGGGDTANDPGTGTDVIIADKGYDFGFTDQYIPPECQTADDCKDKFTDLGQCEVVICNAQQRCSRIGAVDNTQCDDGVDCTKNDVCTSGICAGIPTADCACATDADCADKEDGDLCNGTLFCDPTDGLCKVKPGTEIQCEEHANPCKKNTCVPATGACVEENKADDAPCDDSSACTSEDQCTAGTCLGKAVTCDDGNPCTTDTCDPATGCVYTNNTDGCDDGDFCTVDDHCADGVCTGIDNPACKCKDDAGCEVYENGNLCDGTLICQEYECIIDPATLVECLDTPPACQKYFCEALTGNCVLDHLNDGTTCDDNSLCTLDDACDEGQCKGSPLVCDDGNLCTDDDCNPLTGCVYTNNTDACSDGNFCTENDQCIEGICQGTPKPACECGTDPDCADKEDGDLCNGTLICLNNECVIDNDTIVNCEDPEGSCKSVYCESATGDCIIQNELDGTACEDGNECTFDDYCADGNCVGKPVDCDDDNVCTDDDCDPLAGCTNMNNVLPCDDEDECTVNDTCLDGVCLGEDIDGCQCQLDVNCEPFEDGNFCNGTLVCQEKKCVVDQSTVVTCTSLNPCMTSQCQTETGACIEKPLADGTKCEDGDLCTDDDICLNATCTGKAVECNDDNVCTDDDCLADKGCVYTYNTVDCEDGSTCTENDECLNGQCKGTQVPGCICTANEDCALFEDGDACNGTLICLQNQCVLDPDSIVECDHTNDTLCSWTLCNQLTGVCDSLQADDGTDCDDESICTTVDKCLGGNCVGSVPVDCDDLNPCTDDNCDPVNACWYDLLTDVACEDGDLCTINEMCFLGICESGGDLDCDDGDVCTFDYCLPDSGCEHDPFPDIECCNTMDDCNDQDPCTEDLCVSNTCAYLPVVSPECCTPDCVGKECGPDGCGGFCGTCAQGYCDAAGMCQTVCVPDCVGKECGPDGCGTVCGDTDCAEGTSCQGGVCEACTPYCDGKQCGPDGCGGTCGSCEVSENCDVMGQCVDPCLSCTFGLNCPDLGFEAGNLDGWTYENDVTVQTHLGGTPAPEGQWMAMVGTGVFGEGVGHLKLSLCLPNDITKVKFSFRLYSEEFIEYCGSIYQDYFYARLFGGGNVVDLLNATIDDFCSSTDCAGCGSLYMGLEEADVGFDVGGVWMTPWLEFEADITGLFEDDEPLTLAFFVGDAGDSVFDTLILIDDIQFIAQ
ncbi:MAG: hypothetical protein ISR64_07990 [Deltaproteobacteria bacterium]|nr:hypothetical protein [Deltaproteobacteria bacterium]